MLDIDVWRDHEQLMNSYVKKIRDFFKSEIRLLRCFAANSRYDTSDVAQDSCLQYFTEYADQQSQESIPVALLKQIAFGHLAKNNRYSRSQKRSVEREQSFTEDHTFHNRRPDQQVEDQELKKRVRAAIADLAPKQRQVVELRYFEDLTFVEIGRRMDTSERVVRRVFDNARKSLRIKLIEP